ncbi:hypothetical protein COOONC_08945 [Cooperia oncophora]
MIDSNGSNHQRYRNNDAKRHVFLPSVEGFLEHERKPRRRRIDVDRRADGLNKSFEMLQPASSANLIFDFFKAPDGDHASIIKLLKVLKSFGLREKDPRLKEMMTRIQENLKTLVRPATTRSEIHVRPRHTPSPSITISPVLTD